MREKIVSILFMVVIIAIPIKTFYDIQFVEAKESVEVLAENEISLSANSVSDNKSISDNNVSENGDLDKNDLLENVSQTAEEIGNGSNTVSSNIAVAEEKEVSSMEAIKEGVDALLANIALKEEMAEASNKIAARMSGFSYIESNQVILGKENWLFYKDETDGTPLADYEGTNWYAEEELLTIKNNLVKQRDTFLARGIRFVVMIPPNKEIIYKEYMPPTIFRKNTITKADQLVEYLQLNSDLEVVYPKEDLIESKEAVQLYFKYDTHWNDVGAYVGVQTLMDTLYGISDPLEGKIETGVINLTGDLAIIANMDDIFNNDIEFLVRNYNTQLNRGENLLLIGDSFRTRMEPNLRPYFAQVTDMAWDEFTMAQLDTIQPNIVVWECVERHSNRLLKESLVDQ